MTPELLKWLLGAIGGCTVAIVGAVVWLSVLTFRIGHKYGSVETKLEKFDKAIGKLESVQEDLQRIVVVETKLEQLLDSHAEERRRFASDWPEMKSKVDVLWEKVVSLGEWRRSRPQIGR